MYKKKQFDMVDAYYSELAIAKAQIPKLLVVSTLFAGVIFTVYMFVGLFY
jgi:hypothetical protein